MKMLGHNLTFDSIVRTDELCTYQENEENPDWYVLWQHSSDKHRHIQLELASSTSWNSN